MTEKPYAYPENWQNIGDVNPKRHGGIFVKWERDMWHIVETRHPADLPEDVAKGRFMFEHCYMEPMDIWQEGTPEKGFTEWAEKNLSEFSHGPFDTENVNNPDLPDSVTFQEHMSWIVDNHLEWVVNSLALSFTGYHSGQQLDFEEDYWDYLSGYGIEEENF